MRGRPEKLFIATLSIALLLHFNLLMMSDESDQKIVKYDAGCSYAEVNYTGCNEPHISFDIMEADQLANYSLQSKENCQILTFLYSKRVYGCSTSACNRHRFSQFSAVVDPDKRQSDHTTQQAYQILRDLISADSDDAHSSDHIPHGTMSFAVSR
jgi:hypothetical protein